MQAGLCSGGGWRYSGKLVGETCALDVDVLSLSSFIKACPVRELSQELHWGIDVLISAPNPNPFLLIEEPTWNKGVRELYIFVSLECQDCTVAIFVYLGYFTIKTLGCIGCFRGADSLNETCNWNSICLFHLLYCHLRAKRRGWSMTVLAWDKQQWFTETEARERASLGNEMEELDLSGWSSPDY